MSGAGDLRRQLREDDDRAERYLDAHASALVSAANVCITLATALAGGIVLLAHSTASTPTSSNYLVWLTCTALATVLSLGAGVVAYVGYAGVNRRAMAIYNVRREKIRDILITPSEGDIVDRHLDAIPEITDAVDLARRQHAERVELVGNAVAFQAALLVVAVAIALLAAGYAYAIHAL